MSRWMMLLCLFLVISGCAAYATQQLDFTYGKASPENRVVAVSEQDAAFYNDKVRPILDTRCVSCHACYDAPCQLKLTSSAGIERGASASLVYDGTRLLSASPTRLYLDAKTTEAWREKGFHPVLNERGQSPAANLNGSLLYRSIAVRQAQGAFTQPILSDDYDFSLAREQQCVSIEEIESFEEKYPNAGMPYGLPALSKDEYSV